MATENTTLSTPTSTTHENESRSLPRGVYHGLLARPVYHETMAVEALLPPTISEQQEQYRPKIENSDIDTLSTRIENASISIQGPRIEGTWSQDPRIENASLQDPGIGNRSLQDPRGGNISLEDFKSELQIVMHRNHPEQKHEHISPSNHINPRYYHVNPRDHTNPNTSPSPIHESSTPDPNLTKSTGVHGNPNTQTYDPKIENLPLLLEKMTFTKLRAEEYFTAQNWPKARTFITALLKLLNSNPTLHLYPTPQTSTYDQDKLFWLKRYLMMQAKFKKWNEGLEMLEETLVDLPHQRLDPGLKEHWEAFFFYRSGMLKLAREAGERGVTIKRENGITGKDLDRTLRVVVATLTELGEEVEVEFYKSLMGKHSLEELDKKESIMAEEELEVKGAGGGVKATDEDKKVGEIEIPSSKPETAPVSKREVILPTHGYRADRVGTGKTGMSRNKLLEQAGIYLTDLEEQPQPPRYEAISSPGENSKVTGLRLRDLKKDDYLLFNNNNLRILPPGIQSTDDPNPAETFEAYIQKEGIFAVQENLGKYFDIHFFSRNNMRLLEAILTDIPRIVTMGIAWADEIKLLTLLDRAIMRGNLDMASLIISKGASMFELTPTLGIDGGSMMHKYISRGYDDAVLFLLQNGYPPNGTVAHQTSPDGLLIPLHFAAVTNTEHRVINVLLSQGADVNIVDKTGKNALMVAIQCNNALVRKYNSGQVGRPLEPLQALVKGGIDVSAMDEGGNTALHYAAWTGKKKYIKFLVDAGVNKRIRNLDGKLAVDCVVPSALERGCMKLLSK
ncbi:hypothetical protein TWF694_006560 [Orbilia ellipsospora]|uniref:Ankyrin repeat protein n=1 Tax=Orbilia ellipsospora TaxID=2528407 RepID=A0AAV9XM46_9PEZI